MIAFLKLITEAVSIYIWVLITATVVSLLLHFGILNRSSRFVLTVEDVCFNLTEPALKPIRRLLRRFLPVMQIDLSPIVLILLLNFFVNLLWEIFARV
jgi:YggT family protein